MVGKVLKEHISDTKRYEALRTYCEKRSMGDKNNPYAHTIMDELRGEIEGFSWDVLNAVADGFYEQEQKYLFNK